MTNNQLENLYIKYHRMLYLYGFSLCKNHYKTQDLVSDTFFKALLSLDDDTPYIKYWLFRTCKNLFIDQWRKEKRYRPMENLDERLVTAHTPLDLIIDNEERRQIYTQVMKLSPSYKEAIILYYYCDFKLKEIAQTSGITENAAKVLLFRARKKLKKILEGEQ